MEQGTLFGYLKRNKTLSEEDAAKKVCEIAKAVHCLHEQGVAHRDIKPENIVMSNVIFDLLRMFASYVTLDGLQFVMKEEKHIAELLIMLLQKFYQEHNMI